MEDCLRKLIDAKAEDLNGQKELAGYVAKKIAVLNDVIDQKRTLTDRQVEDILSELIGIFTTTLKVPIPTNSKLLRARVFKTQYLANNVSELSFIPDSEKHLASIGRLNKDGQSVYYGCVYFDDRKSVNVAFSEVEAETADTVNVLKSLVTEDINVYYIGIFDHVHRQCKPRFMTDEMFNYFTDVYKYQENKFNADSFLAHVLCDAFLSDLLRRKGSDSLYKVTSQLFSIFSSNEQIDGILYPSVKSEGDPVVALKTTVVGAKLSHTSCDSYRILSDYGYAKFRADHTHQGYINNDRAISWR